MTQKITNQQVPLTRIANFTNVSFTTATVLTCDRQSVEETIAKIRMHADLPYVFVVSGEQAALVADILHHLKAIRSSCYPHALFVIDGDFSSAGNSRLDIINIESALPGDIEAMINSYAGRRFIFDKNRLCIDNPAPLPVNVDVLIVGGGITGMYAADRLTKERISCCVIEKQEMIGGIWSMYANSTSQVNTSEGAYRLVEKDMRSNRDHSSAAEILEDLSQLSAEISEVIFTGTKAEWIERNEVCYRTRVRRNGKTETITSKGLILAINDRVGNPRTIAWENQHLFKGLLISGTSDESAAVDWQGQKVAVVGMGAFAVENARTALERGAEHVSVICRRHGTVCPKIIDYLNFATPYDDKFQHDRRSNIRNMMLWKKLYDASGATQPECWMGKIKHEGHTISVSDIWFIAHYLKKLETVTGTITGMYEHGVIVDQNHRIDADIVVNCVGFHRNAPLVKELCDYREIYNNNYVDKDFMYLADAYIDDDVFNSFFGSSVLEMTKFYLDVYIEFFNNPEYETMIQTEGIEKFPIEDRRWSQYILGAESPDQKIPAIL